MRLEDYEKLTLSKLKGLWSRGAQDTAPLDYFLDCLNIDFDPSEVRTRKGLSSAITLGYGAGNGKVVRFVNFFNPTAGIITLILDNSGNLYSFSSRAGDTATAPLITVAAATDFSAIQVLGKIFIAFHNGETGLSGVNLKVYIPAAALANDEIRDAAGLAPSAAVAMTAANGAASTLMNAGTYKIAVVDLTTSGHYTVPGPEVTAVFTPTTYISPGAVKISLSVIPTLTNMKRQIIITKADLEEYFFLPSAFGGFINDDSTTTATLDFDDTTDLVDSADYLFDQLETIPAPLGLDEYHARLITLGEYSNQSIARASRPGEPESFDAVDGVIVVNKDDGFICKNSAILRDVFYIHKSLGVFAVQDNGDVPANWAVYPVDRSINTPIHGISEFFNLSGIRAARDWYLTIDRSGIILNNGSFVKPPITYVINDLWQRFSFAYYHKAVLAVDEQTHRIFCAIPIDASTENNLLLFGDYNECPGTIPDASTQWTPWELKPGGTLKRPTALGLIAIAGDTVPTLKFGSIDGGGKIWKLDPTATLDVATAIESFIETSLLLYVDGFVHFFTAVRMRMKGSGNLEISIRGEDNILPISLFSASALSSISFFGSGLDDITLSGTYSGGSNKEFVIKITTAAATDKFKWSSDGGQTFSAETSITGAAQLLSDGVSVTFGVITGHTLNDYWAFQALNNPLALSASPGQEVLARFSFTNEKAKLKFRLTSGYFTINKIEVFGKAMYSMRPS